MKQSPYMKSIKLFTMMLASLTILLTSIVTINLFSPTVASASSTGCTFYGEPMYPTLARAQFCGKINGSNTYVQSIGGAYIAAGYQGWLSNSSLKVEFLDNYGNVNKTYQSDIQTGYQSVGGWGWTINSYEQPGTIRFTLLSNGATISVVQERIGS
jgi:hypothetical protein